MGIPYSLSFNHDDFMRVKRLIFKLRTSPSSAQSTLQFC